MPVFKGSKGTDMNKFCIILIILLPLSGYGLKKEISVEKIYWNKDYLLTWNDFLGQPLLSSKNGAVSYIVVDPHYEYKSGILTVEVRSYFNSSKSWSKEKKQTIKALKHEQGHFDIAEIYSREFKKAAKESKFRTNNVKNKMAKINQRINLEHIKCQDLYDRETNHHLNEAAQLNWNNKIAMRLEDLEEYSEPNLIINVK